MTPIRTVKVPADLNRNLPVQDRNATASASLLGSNLGTISSEHLLDSGRLTPYLSRPWHSHI